MTLVQILDLVEPIGEKLNKWLKASLDTIPNIVIAILVLAAFRFLAGYISKIVTRLLTRTSHNVALVGMISGIVKAAVVAAGVFFALGVLGLDKTVTSLLAGAGVLALAVGFAFQDLTTNFISGAFIAIQRPIAVGDLIETNGFTGKVISIGLRSVKLDNLAGQTVELPSKDIFQKPILNFTHSGDRKVTLDGWVSYQDDLSVVENVAVSTIKGLNFLNPDKAVDFNFIKFTGQGVEFQIGFWIDQNKIGPGPAKSMAIKNVKAAFDQKHIKIPFASTSQDINVQMVEKK